MNIDFLEKKKDLESDFRFCINGFFDNHVQDIQIFAQFVDLGRN